MSPPINRFHPSQKETERKILSAEDIHTNQKVIKSMLHKLGYTNIDFSYDGLETLRMIEKKKYDIILLDIKMPKIDGFTIAKELSKYHFKDGKPFIIGCTANVSKSDREKYMKYMDAILTKPILMEELSRLLKTIPLKK